MFLVNTAKKEKKTMNFIIYHIIAQSQYYCDRLATVVFVIKLINIAEKNAFTISHTSYSVK